MKSFVKSKTIFFNAVFILMAMVLYFQDHDLKSFDVEKMTACLVAASNLVLRFMTNTGIYFKLDRKPDDQGSN